jgi:hypothetical protein
VHGQRDLSDVVETLRPSSRLACRLHCREQQGNHNTDDRNDH